MQIVIHITDVAAAHMGESSDMPISRRHGGWWHVCVLAVFGMSAGLTTAEAAPIVVSTIQDLQNITNNLNGDYILGSDINASGFAFTPIGTSSGLRGTLDGNGHTINDLTITSNSGNAGLFSYTFPSAQITDLGLKNIKINASSAFTVGALAGNNEKSLDHMQRAQ